MLLFADGGDGSREKENILQTIQEREEWEKLFDDKYLKPIFSSAVHLS